MASHLTKPAIPSAKALEAAIAASPSEARLVRSPVGSGLRGTAGVRAKKFSLAAERPLDLTPWPSRRRADYVTALLLVNSSIGLVMMYAHEHPLVLGFGAAAILAWTLGLTWIVWGVMDRY